MAPQHEEEEEEEEQQQQQQQQQELTRSSGERLGRVGANHVRGPATKG